MILKYFPMVCKNKVYIIYLIFTNCLAAHVLFEWIKAQGMDVQLLQQTNRTPLLFVTVPATTTTTSSNAGTVLMYAHFDKQPPMTGWDTDKSPYSPIIVKRDSDGADLLYGRGSADDGYGVFAAVTAILALKKQNVPHAKCVIIVEGSEECMGCFYYNANFFVAGSPDLPYYIEMLKEQIGTPNYVVCLDSGAG